MEDKIILGDVPKLPLKRVAFTAEDWGLDTSKSYAWMNAAAMNGVVEKQYSQSDSMVDFLDKVIWQFDVVYKHTATDPEKAYHLIGEIGRFLYPRKLTEEEDTAATRAVAQALLDVEGPLKPPRIFRDPEPEEEATEIVPDEGHGAKILRGLRDAVAHVKGEPNKVRERLA